MRIRRDISSIPVRSARETWAQILDLVTGKESKDKAQLQAVAGVMASIITDEHLADRALILEGIGPQLKIYCRYGMTAVEEGSGVDRLNWNPTAGNWTMHVPCDAENIEWVSGSLRCIAPRIKVFDVSEAERAEDDAMVEKAAGIAVDWNIKGGV
jgi:hypothetical protein